MYKTVHFTAFLIVFVPSVFTKCQKSFMTICDNFEDLKNLSDGFSIKRLMIGLPFESRNPLISINLNKDVPWSTLSRLRSLYINGKLRNLEVDDSIALNCKVISKLIDFTLHDNFLETIDVQQFPQIQFKELNLANNSVKNLKRGALFYLPVEELDLSDNNLQSIAARTLPALSKIIKIQNNALSFIEPGSFSDSLNSLWLDNNHLAYLEPEVFLNLNNLRFLSLSGNYFYSIPNVQPLNHLQSLDLSSNRIKTVNEQVLTNAHHMFFLDLSNNEIDNKNILRSIFQNKSKYLVVSLAFNNLEGLNTYDNLNQSVLIGKQAVLFYGNPFNCERWNFLQKRFKNYTSVCNSQFLADSRTPFCLASGYTKEHVQRFQNLSRQRAKNFYCKDYRGKYGSDPASAECGGDAAAFSPSSDDDYDQL